MEHYQVITRGRCAKNQSLQSVAANLLSNNIAEPLVKKLLSGKVAVVKQKQTWEGAKRLQKKLYQFGLITELQLQLNPEVFYQGLIKNAASDTVITPEQASLIGPFLARKQHT
jgi:hypothetical protein